MRVHDTLGNSALYFYQKNLQGDIVAVLTDDGYTVASYTYDAWGKVTSSGSIAQINPIRYRGYYYDTDTGFYYLQSRYYDPAVKRFINADSYVNANGDFIGFNMYAYCGNNSIFYKDSTGTWRSKTEIHNAVGENISQIHSGLIKNKDTYMRYNNDSIHYGYCDLYHQITGEVWEIKRWRGGPSCSKFAARRQLENYVENGYLVYAPNLKLDYGGKQTKIQSNGFLYPDKDGEGQYWVYYWDAGEGIIFYDYIYFASEKEVAEAATVAVTIILLAVTAYAWMHGIPVPLYLK